MENPSKVVITGLGCVSPFGCGVKLLWENLLSGRQAFSEITAFDTTPFRNSLGGVVREVTPLDGETRAAAFLRLATVEALKDAGLDKSPESPVGCCLGTNFGSAQNGLEQLRQRAAGKTTTDLSQASMGAALDTVNSVIPCHGPTSIISLACASSGAAIGTAMSWIRSGRADIVIAGGYDELSEHCYAGLNGLRAISKTMVRPFHAQRDGTLFAEGAGVMVLEAAAHARKRGATALGRVAGYSVNNDAFHMTAPDKTGHGIATVMEMAIGDGEMSPEEISHLNCHGTGTKYNDSIETLATKKVFGKHAHKLLLTSNKSAFGHTMGAARALEGISTVLSIRDGVVPPTVGLDEIDPELDLDYCPNEAREKNINAALCNSYGFGGTNASVLYAKAR